MKRSLPLLAAFVLTLSSGASSQGVGGGAEILKRSRHVVIKGSRIITTDSVEVLILDRNGEPFTNVEVPFKKGEKFSFGHARIVTPAGNVAREFKKKGVGEKSYLAHSTLYSDTRLKYFSLRHNVYPYILSYSFSRSTDKFFSALRVAPSAGVGTRQGRAVLQTPPGYPVLYAQGGTDEPDIEYTPSFTRYTWEYSSPRMEIQIGSPPRPPGIPYITAQPRTFTYGVGGSWDTWESFGNWIYRLNEGLDELPPWEKSLIDALVDGVVDTREKVRRLYHHLQDNHRYINVSIDIGGMKSYPAEYVCVNRYGDCKALSNYFRAVLKYVGIESCYTLVNLGSRIAHFDEGFPSQVFNHAIVTVPDGGDLIFVECTSRVLPFGYVGTSLQGRKALVTMASGSHLTDIPALGETDVASVYGYRLRLEEGGRASVSLRGRLRGPEYEKMVNIGSGWSAGDAEMYMRNVIVEGSFTLGNYSISRTGRDSPVAELTVDGNIGNHWKRYGSDLVISPLTLELPVWEAPAERKLPVQIDYPVDKTLTAVYDLSQLEGEPAGTPHEKKVDSRFGTYSITSAPGPGGVEVTKRLTVRPGIIPLEEYAEWYTFITEARNLDNSNLVIEIR